MKEKISSHVKKSIHVVIRGLDIGMQFLLYHAVACFIAGLYMGDSQNQSYYLGLLLFPLVIFAWTREYVHNLLLFMFIHIAVFAGLLSLGRHGAELVAFFVCGIIMLINSLLYRLSEKYRYDKQLYTETPHIAMCFFFVGISLLGLWTERPQIETLCYQELILFLLFYMIHENLYNTEKFLKINAEAANMPTVQLKGVSRILLVFFVILSVAAMLIFPRLHLEVAVKGIGKILLYLLRAFFALFRRGEAESEPILDTTVDLEATDNGFLLEPTDPSWLAVFLQNLVLFITQIGIVIGIVAGVSYALYQLYKHFYGIRRSETDESEFIAGKVFTERVFLRRRVKRERQEKTVNQKMRNIYKKYIKKKGLVKGMPPAHLTPTELEMYMKQKEQDAVSEQEKERILLYEKARYGGKECTREELEEMKRLVQENLR